MINYNDLVYGYGIENVKQLGNKIIVIDRHYHQAIGYEIVTYNGYTPDTLKNKVYTSTSNLNGVWDDIYDYLYGDPVAPDFKGVIA